MVGWKQGCQPFSCPCSENVTHWPKEICLCLSKARHPFALFLFLQRHSTHADIRESARGNCWVASRNPTRTSLRVDVWVVNQWWIRMIFHRKFSVPQIMSSLDPSNSCLSQWSFDYSRFLGRPAFQLHMFAKCDALPQRELSDMFVLGMHSRYSFFTKTFNSLGSESPQGWIIELGVTIQLEHRQGRCLSCESVMYSNDLSPWIFCTQICCPCLIQATHACHSEVSIGFYLASCCGILRCRPHVNTSH